MKRYNKLYEYSDFDFFPDLIETLSSKSSIKKRLAYLDIRFKKAKIGTGSSRKVYQLNKDFVLKLAYNKKGLAQNKNEAMISSSKFSDIIATVIDYGKDFSFIIQEYAKPVSMTEINKLLKFNVRGLSREDEDYKESHLEKRIKAFIKKFDLDIYAIAYESSWGIKKGKPVIIDFGFTREVGRKYYDTDY